MQEMEERGVEAGFEHRAPEFDPADFEPRPFPKLGRRRAFSVVGVLVALVLVAVLPPLINVSRFQRQIATSISRSLGRPVHMDSVTLNLLPLPEFILENFVVAEDPAFGSEPVIRANLVRARVRVRSLWRRRLEFSRISLTDTSLNLVHRADGRWNFESILLQAAKIDAAPTAQRTVSEAPRFPYIEATGARVNVKMGLEKMPLALTEAEFALWLPKPEQWRLRLEGHPSRTDTAAMDTGTVRVQGTLGRAGTLADLPIDLAAEWRAAPLGAVSWVLMGRDAGFRGDMTLQTNVAGTVGENVVDTRLELRQMRRTEFVPAKSLDVNVACKARAAGVFHRLSEVRCTWPPDAAGSGVVLTGVVPDAMRPRSAVFDATATNVNAGGLLDGLRVGSPRVAAGLTLGGSVAGQMTSEPLAGRVTIAKARLADGDGAAFVDQDVSAVLTQDRLELAPIALELGGIATLEGHLDRAGYGMHLMGTMLRSRLIAMAAALPQFGDGLVEALPTAPVDETIEAPMRVDLVSARAWSGGQVWTATAARPADVKKRRRRRR